MCNVIECAAKVLASAAKSLAEHRIETLIVEINDEFWRDLKLNKEQACTDMSAVWDYGYNATQVKSV
jgi:hypothetical protein